MIINKNKLINWLPALVWMLVIFLFSAQPASESNQLSVGFTKVLVDALGRILPLNIEISTINDLAVQLNHIIRKFAHFTVYLILGILVSRALVKNRYKGRVMLTSFLICAIYAGSDELHQLFVQGRGGQLKDVFIDSMGSFVGITLSNFLYMLRKT